MIQAIKGTKDILPDYAGYWQFIEEAFRKVSSSFGYNEIRTPIFEKTEVFARSIGEGTDIVNKEMFTFSSKGGTSITLRPENTAAIVRSVLQNSMLQQGSVLRLWYFGPFFRYERPQQGRQRQFHQYGAECISSPNPEADAEIILLADRLFRAIGIDDYKMLLNTLGTNESRNRYRKELYSYMNSHKDRLSADSVSRLETNPLRILDSKDERDIEIINSAPVILDYLDEESSIHFETVRKLLDASGIEYEIEPKLVRGLDYYSHTVFEFRSDYLGAQDSFGGGGRYDGLFSQLEGKPTPAVGFALGIERMLLILEKSDRLPDLHNAPDIYLVQAGPELTSEVNNFALKLRRKGLKVITDLQKRSIKAQFRESNKLGAKYTIVLGENEISSGKAVIKKMENGEETETELIRLEDFNF